VCHVEGSADTSQPELTKPTVNERRHTHTKTFSKSSIERVAKHRDKMIHPLDYISTLVNIMELNANA